MAAGVELQVQVPLPLQWGYREYRYRRPAFNLLCWQPDEWCSPQTPHFQYNMRSTSRSQGSPAEVYPATAGASQFAVPFPLKLWDFSKFQSRSCGKSRGTFLLPLPCKTLALSRYVTHAGMYHKNSSTDEIANVNFLRRYRTRTSEYQKENLLRLTN